MFRVASFLLTVARKSQKMVRMFFEQSLKKKEESLEEVSKQRCGHLQGVLQGRCKLPFEFCFSYSGFNQVHNRGVGMEFDKFFFFQKAGSVQNEHVGQRTFTLQEP
jgi:hypothetical protein